MSETNNDFKANHKIVKNGAFADKSNLFLPGRSEILLSNRL